MMMYNTISNPKTSENKHNNHIRGHFLMLQIAQAERGGGAIRGQPYFLLMVVGEPLTGVHHQGKVRRRHSRAHR